MWIAEAVDTPVGYVGGHLTRRFKCDGEVQWLYVVANYRRTGVRSELLRLLMAWFRGREARRICVDVGDEDARPFYQRHGAIDLNKHWMVWNDIQSAG